MKAPLVLLRVSQACQSTLHLKFDSKMALGQFLTTNVTVGQLMALPNLRIERLKCLDLSVFLIRAGVNRIRLILRSALV